MLAQHRFTELDDGNIFHGYINHQYNQEEV